VNTNIAHNTCLENAKIMAIQDKNIKHVYPESAMCGLIGELNAEIYLV